MACRGRPGRPCARPRGPGRPSREAPSAASSSAQRRGVAGRRAAGALRPTVISQGTGPLTTSRSWPNLPSISASPTLIKTIDGGEKISKGARATCFSRLVQMPRKYLRPDPSSFIGKKWTELPSPCMVVYEHRVAANSRRMADKAKALGVSLRPHMKTHKTIEGGMLQCGGNQSNGIVVSTIEEAFYFAEGGFTDITYGIPITTDKLPSLKMLAEDNVRIRVLLDDPQAVEPLNTFWKNAGLPGGRLVAWIKVDTGYHRAGVEPSSDAARGLVQRLLAADALEFCGLYSHTGHSYATREAREAAGVAETDRLSIVAFAEKLRADGIDVPIVSVGSSPACASVQDMAGVTEMHPGNYPFSDRQQVATGACSLEDCAALVVTRVVSHHPERNTLLVDAGALALSKDVAPQGGYGEIVGHPELDVARPSQEESVVIHREGKPLDYASLPLGTPVMVIPNHSCLAAACHSVYYVLSEEGVVTATWTPTRGW